MFDITAILQSVHDYVAHLVGGNQFAVGAILTALTTGVLMLLRRTPVAIFEFVVRQSVTKLRITNDGWNNRQAFVTMASFLKENCLRDWSRAFRLESSYDYDSGKTLTVLAIGAGWHIIKYEGRTVWAHRAEHPSNQGDTIKEDITLYVLGRSTNLLQRLVDACLAKAQSDGVTVNEWNSKEQKWITVGALTGFNLDSLALDPDIRAFFESEIAKFRNERDFLIANGMPHKLTTILHGLSGSGKTALIRALAGHFRINLFTVNLGALHSLKDLSAMLRGLPRNSMLLMEDFEGAGGVSKRHNISTIHGSTGKDKGVPADAESVAADYMSAMGDFGAKSDILNFLDGVVPLDGAIIFMTTNVAVDLDAAMLRPGRIDHVIDLPQISVAAVRSHLLTVWPELQQRDVRWSVLPGCILYRIKREALRDVNTAQRLINYYHDNPGAAEAEQQGELVQLDRIRAMRERLAAEEQEAKSEDLETIAPAASAN